MSKRFLVVGGGFRGIAAALHLLKAGHSVKIIDAGKAFGGIMYSRQVGGFFVDNGVHMFDSIPEELAEIIDEIMNGKTAPIDFISSSAMHDSVTDGFSLPDLSSLPRETRDRITGELITLACSDSFAAPSDNLQGVLENRYGATAAEIMRQSFAHIYGIEPSEVSSTTLSQTSFGRLKHLSDAEMLILKSNPKLDQVLAARRKTMGKLDDLVSIYPNDGRGMRGFCIQAEQWFHEKGVETIINVRLESVTKAGEALQCHLSNGRRIEADHLIWANENTAALSKVVGIQDQVTECLHGTPMVLATFTTKASSVKDCTYLQNFTPGAFSYRSAAAGIYSDQVRDDDTTFVTFECPARLNSNLWSTPEAHVEEIWAEAKKLGMVDTSAPLLDSNFAKARVTNRLHKKGFQAAWEALDEEVTKKFPRMHLADPTPFNRRQIYEHMATVSQF